MIDLAVSDLNHAYSGEALLEHISFELHKGECVALLGNNGSGKTTLFKIIMGYEPPTSGNVFTRKSTTLGYLNQQPNTYDLTVREVLFQSFEAVLLIRSELTRLENEMSVDPQSFDRISKKYAKLTDEYISLGGYDLSERYMKVLAGLKLQLLENQPFESLSGGEKTRVELGKILLENPDILLLDEPTNHLDIEMVTWLEQYLKSYHGSVLIISHDRYFLDQMVNKIFEIHNKTLEVYHGNYTYYLSERELRYENEMKKYNQHNRKVEQLEVAAKRMRDWAKRADNEAMFKKAKSIERRIERMGETKKPLKDLDAIKGQFKQASRSAKEVVKIQNHAHVVGGKTLIKAFDLNLYYQDKVGLIGPNGCGKSTLIQWILENDVLGPRVEVGYLKQDVSFEITGSIYDVFKHYHPMQQTQIRNYLAKFNFKREEVFLDTESLSGGERVRLMLAILMKSDINFLVLDEPTNHIDIKTREILEELLLEYEGTILFVSHDRFFLNQLANKIISIDHQTLRVTPGNYDDYLKQKEVIKTVRKVKEKPIRTAATKKDSLEQEIEELENSIKRLEESLYNLTYVDYEENKRVSKEIEMLQKELEHKLETYFQ